MLEPFGQSRPGPVRGVALRLGGVLFQGLHQTPHYIWWCGVWLVVLRLDWMVFQKVSPELLPCLLLEPLLCSGSLGGVRPAPTCFVPEPRGEVGLHMFCPRTSTLYTTTGDDHVPVPTRCLISTHDSPKYSIYAVDYLSKMSVKIAVILSKIIFSCAESHMHIFRMLVISLRSLKMSAWKFWETLIAQSFYPILKPNLKKSKMLLFFKNIFCICT